MNKQSSKIASVLLLVALFGVVPAAQCREDEDKVEPVKVGNLALTTSQQPGPLVGFGQNIIEKGDLQAFVFADYFKGRNKNFTEVAPSILYGISDVLSIFIEAPFAAKFKLNNCVSHGIEDLLVQLEYAFYDHPTLTYGDQATMVANITLPTGSVCKAVPTGVGAPSFFLGFTASHMATDWYYFIASGAILPLSHKGTKFGNQFLYQGGLARNIAYVANTWIFTGMIEIDGTFRQQNKIAGITDQNSGSNAIILGPSLWFSTQRLMVQGGVSWDIYQHFCGCQNKDTFFAAVNIGWKF